jgi:preprotein translocase subunit SecG
MGFIIGVLMAILVLDCLLLILLILIQLPKKEAGVGTAFGGAATDALFGAGKGNALTQMTKYAAGLFFVLAFAVTVVMSQRAHVGDRSFKEALQTQAAETAPKPAAPGGSSNLLQSLTTSSNLIQAATNAVEGNKTASTNPAAKSK